MRSRLINSAEKSRRKINPSQNTAPNNNNNNNNISEGGLEVDAIEDDIKAGPEEEDNDGTDKLGGGIILYFRG